MNQQRTIKGMEDFSTGYVYPYSTISERVRINDFEEEELGLFVIGENFIIVKDNKNKTCSFMLTSINPNDSIYQCIYNDWE